MSLRPLVSVIVPNYNHERFLDERIQSLLRQSYQNIEIILLDDASTDDSVAVLERYRQCPAVCDLLVNAVNTGSPFKQWNTAVNMSRGELILIAESDDVAHPDLIERLVGCMQDEVVVMAYSSSRLVNEHGIQADERQVPEPLNTDVSFEHDFRMKGSEFLLNGQLRYNLVPNASAVLFRRQSYLACQGADPSIEKCGDWLVWCKLMLAGDICFVAAPLNDFRRHQASVIGQVTDQISTFFYDLKFHDAFANYLVDVKTHVDSTLWHALEGCNQLEIRRLRERLACKLARMRRWQEGFEQHRWLVHEHRRGLDASYRIKFAVACFRGWMRGR